MLHQIARGVFIAFADSVETRGHIKTLRMRFGKHTDP